jgi:endoglucanase
VIVNFSHKIAVVLTAAILCLSVEARAGDLPPNWPWRGIVLTSTSAPTSDDIKFLAAMNVNALSLHLDVRQTAEFRHLSPADALKQNMAWADAILDECKKYGMTTVISIFQIPGDPALRISQESPEFWDNPERLKEAVDLAARLAGHFKTRGPELGAYSILSEPVVRRGGNPELPAAWPKLLETVVKTIRHYDPQRYILAAPCIGALPNAYDTVMPLGDPRIIYEAHMYVPHPYTHQGLYGNKLGVAYPGWVNMKKWDKKALEGYLAPLAGFQKKYHALVFIGEFSAIRWAPGSEQYLGDLIDLFDQYGWGWVYFQYKSFHGWDPDYDSRFSSDGDSLMHRAGKQSARWNLLMGAFAKTRGHGKTIP